MFFGAHFLLFVLSRDLNRIASSAVIRDIMSLSEAGLASMAYYYFDFRDTDKQNRRNLLLSLLSQLSAHSDLCCYILHRIYVTHKNGAHKPTDGALMQCLKETLTLSNDRPTYIIIDAVDECPNTFGLPSPREVVLDFVKQLVELSLPHLHICITSRPEIDIRTVIEPLTTRRVSLHDETGQTKDIVDYVSSVVRSDVRMGKWREEDQKLVIETLAEKADGMYVSSCEGQILPLTSPQVPMGILPTRNDTTLFPTKSATYSSGASEITRRNLRLYIEEYQPGDESIRASPLAMSHGGGPASPPR